MITKIASEEVASKLNDWYTAIRQNNLELSVRLKKEIVKDLDHMEENQNVLLYYSLLDFRHKIMLSFYSQNEGNIEENILYLEANKEKMVGLLDYYFWFFKGMYEFKKKDIIEAISCYKKAEEKLYIVDDEIEKAEFHFRLAHFYYYIKKSYLSLNYALYAKDIYKRFPTYKQRCITCEFIIGGNLIDNTNYDEASIVLLNALKGTDSLYDDMLTSFALCNLGICFLKQGSYNSAAEYLSKAIDLFIDQNSTRLPKAIYNLMHVRIKQNRLVEAFNLYEKGMLYSKELEDQEYMVKLNFLKGLYLEPINQLLINETFTYLEKVNKFSDMSELALEVADFYNENKCYEKSVFYYEISRKAENNIKKGENFYEN